jgi:hypothetical protein
MDFGKRTNAIAKLQREQENLQLELLHAVPNIEEEDRRYSYTLVLTLALEILAAHIAELLAEV